MSLYSAKVKSALSGDTLVLIPIGKSPTTPTTAASVASSADPERTLSLAFVSAPRLNSNEPYGFESREYLRTLLVGKQIKFKVLYTINGREYGDVIAPIFTSLVGKSIADGNVKLRDDVSSKEGFEEYEAAHNLSAAQDKAKSSQLGVWSSNQPLNVVSVVPKESLESKKAFNAIVERVISGDRLQLRVILDSNTHFVGQVLIAGIKAPRSSGPDSPPEPFGEVSKQFVSVRLLQRSVTTTFLASSSSGIPIVQVTHPVGDIAEFLLESGLASIADWQSQYLGAQKMGVLRNAEKKARNAKLNLWKDSASSAPSSHLKSYDAVVSKVISSDTFVVRRESNDKEETVQLSSIRAPRKADPSASAYVSLAKEFSRAKFIGKKVHVTVDAIRPKSDNFEERALVSIALHGENIAEVIVQNGYASVIRHRKDDDDRSPIWDLLLEKEAASQASGKGIHSKKPPPPERIIDASETVVKAKGFLSSLERQSRISAVVDHISSGGRFRLHVPRENLILTLVLSGVRVPRPQEPFGEAALEFVTKRLYQRDVHFSVSNVDKTGGFIGNIFPPGNNIPLSVLLVSEGLAEVHEFSASQSNYGNALTEAQAQAQKDQKGLWKDYVDEEEYQEPGNGVTDSSDKGSSSRSYVDVLVTSVSTAGQISYRLVSQAAQYTKLANDLNTFNNAATNSAVFTLKSAPRKGDIVAVRVGGQYVRGRVSLFEKSLGKYTISLLDSGDSISIDSQSIRALPPQFSPTKIPAFARVAELSFIKLPPSSPTDYLSEYVEYLTNAVKDKQVVINVDSPASQSPQSVTIYTEASKGIDDSVNSAIVNDGYAFVRPKLQGWERAEGWKSFISALKEFEQGARSDRVGVWEYGDPVSDEE